MKPAREIASKCCEGDADHLPYWVYQYAVKVAATAQIDALEAAADAAHEVKCTLIDNGAIETGRVMVASVICEDILKLKKEVSNG